NARPVCGFQSPEDLAPLPGGAAIVVSEYGGMLGEKPGDLALLVLEGDERRVLFRGGDATTQKPAEGWGDATCPGPPGPAFAPHGIDEAIAQSWWRGPSGERWFQSLRGPYTGVQLRAARRG
ncbi:MAG: hypothetical protein P8Y15_00655, partial [Gemmatimonadales bacterium]